MKFVMLPPDVIYRISSFRIRALWRFTDDVLFKSSRSVDIHWRLHCEKCLL